MSGEPCNIAWSATSARSARTTCPTLRASSPRACASAIARTEVPTPPPPARRGRTGDAGVGEHVGEGRRMALQYVEQRGPVERRAEHCVDTQRRPVPLAAGGVDGERGAAGRVGGVDEVAVEAVGVGVD